MTVAPLAHIKLRTAELASSFGASFGKVRDWNRQKARLQASTSEMRYRGTDRHTVPTDR
jgi:hypothetical protein